MEKIDCYLNSNVAFISLNDGNNGNMIDMNFLELLSHKINHAILKDEVRAIVLKSSGKHFCLGMKMEFIEKNVDNINESIPIINMYIDLLLKMFESPKPIICVVEGDVRAEGLGIMGVCDIILSNKDVHFEFDELKKGLIPANVLPFIYSLRMLPRKALYLILTCKYLSAPEALETGLIDECLSKGEIESRLAEIIQSIFDSSPHAISKTKHFSQDILGMNLDEASNLAKEKLIELIGSQEIIDGIRSLSNNKKPNWATEFKPQINTTECNE